MPYKFFHITLTYIIAFVWLVNGLFCKVCNLVPRHQQIVSHILGDQYAKLLTILIGIAEILIAIWIVSRIQSRLNALLQIVIITVMNSLEFTLVPDLLLWGHWNVLFAFLFILTVYFNEFYLSKKAQHAQIS
ncbi:DoxX-like family protein [Sphingobacterium sp. SRCM116780]|uniref:DoxX-like family protein n=1 Tax=Sphingobacterium sp. SRCM116780 TaxID=2907623 RepID=UPI001F36A844|nr:DoxX-like family protein [Sphingobacterium sp. SRCM116780]UIR56920.1 DoxX-like family protein [Sphingobacterium sp. SRCM116780]